MTSAGIGKRRHQTSTSCRGEGFAFQPHLDCSMRLWTHEPVEQHGKRHLDSFLWSGTPGTLGSRGCWALLLHTQPGQKEGGAGRGKVLTRSCFSVDTVRKCPERHLCSIYCFRKIPFKDYVILEHHKRKEKNDRMFCFIPLVWWVRSLFRHFSWNSPLELCYMEHTVPSLWWCQKSLKCRNSTCLVFGFFSQSYRLLSQHFQTHLFGDHKTGLKIITFALNILGRFFCICFTALIKIHTLNPSAIS